MKTILTVHATDTPPDMDLTRRDLDLKDRRHGYAEIGYHYVILRSGEVQPGRSLESASIHDLLHKAVPAVAVVMVGGADGSGEPSNNFTEQQRKSLKWLAEEKHPSLAVEFVHPSLKLPVAEVDPNPPRRAA